MAYYLLLKKLIDNSGLSYKEIAEKCKLQGKSIDPSYISKLVNNKISPPSDEITKAIASACNSEPEELIIEAYIDKSPTAVITAFENIKKMLIDITVSMSASEHASTIKEIYDNMPFAEILKSFQNSDNSLLSADKSSQAASVSIKSSDDGMSPIIIKNSSALIINQKSYSKGDIVAIAKDNDEFIFRKYYSLPNGNVILIPQNPSFESIIAKDSDIIILGKVVNIIV